MKQSRETEEQEGQAIYTDAGELAINRGIKEVWGQSMDK